MQLIKGKEIADNILNDIKSKIKDLETKPTLAVILIGEDEASKIYVGLKERAAREIGFNFLLYKYEADVKEEIILNKIEEINNDDNIHGLIVQLPLPENLDKYKVINAISPAKDVDGFCECNQDVFLSDKDCHWPVFPKAIVKMVEGVFLLSCHSRPLRQSFNEASENGNLVCEQGDPRIREDDNFDRMELFGGKKAVIICKSDDFGVVMQRAFERIGMGAKYVFCNDLNSSLDEIKNADIVVSACGQLNLLDSEMVKNDAIIIDGGIIKKDGKVFGDVKLSGFEKTDCFISPVPGGVGPVTVACLLENTYLAYLENRNIGI
ncbi:MAG: Bifunctional protein FolD [Candidatus Moranbacteria bacterium GW2011_GWF2_34_56]|nr:MAG: Bifunctional protein FolD [Candidatus Moranbacteria bacterium GW2011_GWF1_34_10]KKP64778.1 MAG: Bifunctional protein FolD [Candidatus Moranbacteria bacterium GW2011_GWF2_34_56]HBI16845.1 hypothetical protein [Candidatus Moranbacteria bacterium]